MKKILFLLLICTLSSSLHAQKKIKGKDKHEKTDYDSVATAPVSKTSNKKEEKKDKKGKKDTKAASVNYSPEVIEPVADTSKKFIGIIKYYMTSDDPADKDSIFIVFGEHQIRATMFIPGYRADQVFEKTMIANMNDSTFLELDTKKKTYKTEKISARNEGTEFSLIPDKKIGKVMSFTCQEYKGQMSTKEGDIFEVACMLSPQHAYIAAMDYNFMNIQPLVVGYKIVLGFRTKSAENENTYILAYKIEPGNTDAYFDLSGYRAL
jgi:hypothetical protein